jgi:hypothetical protein
MKITNFRNLIVKDSIATAQVDVTTGFWFWKKTETKVVVNKNVWTITGTVINVAWTWADTGKYTPDFEVEELHRAYQATVAVEGRYS